MSIELNEYEVFIQCSYMDKLAVVLLPRRSSAQEWDIFSY